MLGSDHDKLPESSVSLSHERVFLVLEAHLYKRQAFNRSIAARSLP